MGGGDPCGGVMQYTPGCMIVDAVSPPSPPPAPPPAPPACSTYQSGTSELELRGFRPDQEGSRCNNELTLWLEEQRNTFCANINNFTKRPGGDNCIERNAGQALARTYCGTGDRIRTSAACTKEYLGPDSWVQIATTYCVSEAGKAEPWCSCFNVMNGVCDDDPNAAGCAAKASTYDVLVEKTPDAFKTEWSGREACYGLVCQEEANAPKWILDNSNQNCASPVQICGYDISAENLTESNIDAKCNIGGREYDQDGNLVNPGNPAANFVANLPAGIGQYIPLSFSDITGEDPNKKIGVAGSVGASFISCVCILALILLVSSGGGNSGSSRFRR
tara:strand:+ start:1174 stop:2172 length:999 start_codon:yes stop_codon:yes gene_type:complete